MGLFSKDRPADKKLKELTGGFILSSSFIKRLKENNLEISDGTKIKEQLKKEIKMKTVNEYNLESRLTQLINQYSNKNPTSNSPKSSKECPKCFKVQDIKNNVCICCGHQFKDIKKCPKCREVQEDDNKFCINCGYKFELEKKTKKCPICNEVQDASNDVCINCEYDFINKKIKPNYKKCPNCNRRLFDKTMVCSYCGYDFEKQELPDNSIICPQCNTKTDESSKICPNCGYDYSIKRIPETVAKIREYNFLSSYDFNLKNCPNCNTQFLKSDSFCFNCGTSVLTNQTVKNDNLEIKDGKLVAKEKSSQENELSDLEALYSRTVKSKYSPSFKVAYVLYLEEFRKNPSKKFSDKLARHYETTVNKLKKQALEDEFIELASPLAAAKDFKVSDLKEILKEHNLKVSGKKDELIERLGENLSEDELKKHFKSKTYQISAKGLDFLSKNNYILYIHNDDEILQVFYPSEIAKIFGEKEYDIPEIQEMLLDYLKKTFDEKLTNELWVDFKIYAKAIASILEDMDELKQALNIRLKVFLFDINNFSIVLKRPDPKNTKLKQKDMSKLMELLHDLALSIDELKEIFNESYNEVLFEMAISKDDSLIYLLKIFGGEDLARVSLEINESYSNPY